MIFLHAVSKANTIKEFSMTMTILRSYKYQLYRSKKTKYLDDEIEIARQIWNHCLALQKRYYRMYGKYISANRMKVFVASLRRKKFPEWQKLGSQAVQDVVERLDRSYQAFFAWCKDRSGPRKHPPKFKKRWKYHSFTLKQAGWSVEGDVVRIMDKSFRFCLHRPFVGDVKTVTVKRSPHGDYYIVLSVIEEVSIPDTHTGNAVGIDFGLRTFLTMSDGTVVESPQWLKKSLKDVKNANRCLSRKKKGSRNRKRAKMAYAKVHEDIANRRRDWFFKLAHELTMKYSIICIEDLNLNGMKKLWGCKVSDLAYAEFVSILEHEAQLHGCQVVKIDRWYPSSKTCSCCGYVKVDLNLNERDWECPSCRVHHDRDLNAAINIMNHGLLTKYSAIAV